MSEQNKNGWAAFVATAESRAITHAENCWSWGPKHYKCALREIRAKRAEVEVWRELSDRMEAVLDQLQAEIERLRAEVDALREALEEILSRSCMNLEMSPNPYAVTALLGDIYQIADAALAKENSND